MRAESSAKSDSRQKLTPPVKPVNAMTYIDTVQIWLRTKPTPELMRFLEAHSGSVRLFGKYRALFDLSYRWRLQLHQPEAAALKQLARDATHYLNMLHLALDLIFASPTKQDRAFIFASEKMIRRRTRKKAQVKFGRGSQDKWDGAKSAWNANCRYDDGENAANRIALYTDDHSRITGEMNVLHIEWRKVGKPSLRQLGINSLDDLLAFDQRQFWAKKLVAFEFDPEKLGRLDHNQRCNTPRSRSPNDFRRGTIMIAACSTSQDILRRYRKLRLDSAIIRFDMTSWLPEINPKTRCSTVSADELTIRPVSPAFTGSDTTYPENPPAFPASNSPNSPQSPALAAVPVSTTSNSE